MSQIEKLIYNGTGASTQNSSTAETLVPVETRSTPPLSDVLSNDSTPDGGDMTPPTTIDTEDEDPQIGRAHV